MGAPAVRAPAKTRRTQAKPRPASKRGTVQGAAAARKPRPAPSRTAKPRATARRAPARRPVASGGVVALPVAAVGRTAHAVGGIADSGLVQGLARSRAWIGVLGALLAGIVAINVVGLSLSASNSRTAAKIDALERSTSVNRSRIAARTSTDKVQKAASALGLAIPAPDDVHYLHAGKDDAAVAAKRLAAGEIGNSLPADATTTDSTVTTTVDPTATTTATTTVDPTTGATIDPTTGATIDPTTGAPIDPATGAPIDPATGLPATTTSTTTVP
jgi:hypothetical protein